MYNFFTSGITVGFEQTYLEVEESATSVELCVNITELSNPDEADFNFKLEVSTERRTACEFIPEDGGSSSPKLTFFYLLVSLRDFSPLRRLSLGRFDHTSQRQCFEVDIRDDRDTENSEEFVVRLSQPENSDSYYPQTIEPDTATVRILDNDCKAEGMTLTVHFVYCI